HEVGCVACHQPNAAYKISSPSTGPSPTGSVPFPDLKAKYTLDALANFLRRPLQHRPSGRMPDLKLQMAEASDIASYLLKIEVANTVDQVKADAALAGKGMAIFNSVGCANCHTLKGSQTSLA